MRRLIAVCAAVLLAAVAGLATLPLWVSADTVRDEVTGRLAALTGYEVEIAGDAELRRFPWLRFAVSDVRLRPPGGAVEAEVAHIESLAGSVALLPLILGRIEIDSLMLRGASLHLEIDREGRRNWSHANAGWLALAVTGPEAVRNDGRRIGEMRIERGSLDFVDRRSGERHKVEDMQGTLAWSGLAAPLAASGSLTWRGDTVRFNIQADQPISFLRRGTSSARIEIESPAANVSFVGEAHLTDNPHLRGRLSLSTGSVRGLLRELGIDIGTGAGLDMLELSGQISLLGPTAIISGLGMRLDGNRGEGSLKVDIEPDHIGLQGTLAFDTLDLNPYLAASDGPDPVGEPVDPITRAIDLSDLQKAVADIRISANRVEMEGLRLGETAGTLTVREGALTAGIAQTALHGGIAMGTVTVTPQGDGVDARLDASMEGIALAGMLANLGIPQRLDGTARATASLSGSGSSLGEILSSLSGETRLVVREGAIRGIDLPAVIEAVSSRRLVGWPGGSGAQTSFDELSGSLTLKDGVATTRDLKLSGPRIDLTLDAEIRLAAGSINGRGKAALPSAGGQEGRSLVFLVEGPIEEPSLYLDPETLLERVLPGQAIGRLTRDGRIDRAIRRGLERLPDALR